MTKFALAALVALGALFNFSFGPGKDGDSARPFQAEAPASMQIDTILIEIVADADSVIAVPSVVEVEPGQVVTWNSELGEWTVFFQSAQPFGEGAVGQGIRGGRGQRNGQAVRNEAAEGRYKYDILVRIQGGGTLRADPEIVVGRRTPR